MKNDIQPGPEHVELQKRRMFALAGFGAASAINCMLFLFAFQLFEPDRLSLSDRYFPSATVTATRTSTPTPTLTPTRTSTPTTTVTPTPHVLITPSGGENVLAERFDSNERDWHAYFTDNTVLVENGKLTLRSEDAETIGIAYCTDCPSLADPFYFQAEVSTAENTIDPYGLAFCSPGFGPEFYVFQINPRTHLYDLYKHSARGWKTLTVTNFSPAINAAPNSNILGVQFDRGEINLFINNVQMKSYQDDDPFECRRSGFIVNGGGFDMVVDNVFAYTVGSTPAPSPQAAISR